MRACAGDRVAALSAVWEERGTEEEARKVCDSGCREGGGGPGKSKPRRGDEAASAGPLAARRVAGTMG